jgi:REP element-mobilizing transposase RayT
MYLDRTSRCRPGVTHVSESDLAVPTGCHPCIWITPATSRRCQTSMLLVLNQDERRHLDEEAPRRPPTWCGPQEIAQAPLRPFACTAARAFVQTRRSRRASHRLACAASAPAPRLRSDQARGGDDFRVIHLSIQKNHIHLIVEAAHKDALRRGMQRFAIRAARALNVHFKRAGKVFAFRYLAKQIKSADYARNALSYVLNNWRKHRADHDEKKGDTLFDVFSSARSLAGWTEKYQRELARAKPPPEYEVSLPVSLPRTALLRSQWQWHGLIDPFERPRPLA